MESNIVEFRVAKRGHPTEFEQPLKSLRVMRRDSGYCLMEFSDSNRSGLFEAEPTITIMSEELIDIEIKSDHRRADYDIYLPARGRNPVCVAEVKLTADKYGPNLRANAAMLARRTYPDNEADLAGAVLFILMSNDPCLFGKIAKVWPEAVEGWEDITEQARRVV